MIFLGPIYNEVVKLYANKINHFPLISLSFHAFDKAIFYTLIFIVLRVIWIRRKNLHVKLAREFWLTFFLFYILLLYFLTVFRDGYFPWQFHFEWHRSLSYINTEPLIETFKLSHGISKVDFYYNLFGNILWFIPIGIFLPYLWSKNMKFYHIVIYGALISLSIETLQFFLATGVSDIDDVITNTIGAIVGYILYRAVHSITKKV
ncbi:VanZ family protein [Lactobacillus terrae]|uniref:VanZ family protein n=1 Tax=Lactobacillus terrae TaxID=2269374 RepID=UPI000C1B6808|nr:VanZ family protein [Lactobacillus terrae]